MWSRRAFHLMAMASRSARRTRPTGYPCPTHPRRTVATASTTATTTGQLPPSAPLPPPPRPQGKPQIDESSEDFWTVPASNTNFWSAYVRSRPNYSADFYRIIYDYHDRHQSSPTSHARAHDVGCGAGQVAGELATRFTHVNASDNVAAHVDVARQRLSSTYPGDRISYTLSKGEDLYRHHPPGSADLVAAAEAMVLMDTPAGLSSFSTLLRPGGTLAAWFYGRPTFSDPELFQRAQPLIDGIMWRNWAKVIRPSGPQRLYGFKRCADAMASWLDYVDFDPATWRDVRRLKWNTHGTLAFFGRDACGFEIDPISNVKPEAGETVEERTNPDFWKNEWTVGRVREYFRVLYPGFEEAHGPGGDPEIEELFAQLTREMGGEGAVKQFTWPAVLVLATRR